MAKKTKENYMDAINQLDFSDVKGSLKVLRYALNSYPELFNYCVEKGMKTNKLTMKQLVQKCDLVCEFLPEKYKNDIEYCSYIAKYNPRILKYCNPEFLEKDEIIRLSLYNGKHHDVKNPEHNFKMSDLFKNLSLETYESIEYKEKVMNIFFEEVEKKKIDYYSMNPNYYFDSKWLMDITVFNVIVKNCILETEKHDIYDLRYKSFFEKYLIDYCTEITTNKLILNRITELLTNIDFRLNKLLSVNPFSDIVNLIYSILVHSDTVKDIKEVIVLRRIDVDLALKYEKKFRLNNNLDYQLLIGNDANILESLSNTSLYLKEVNYILKNYPIYYNDFEQFFLDYKNAGIAFYPDEIIENEDLLNLIIKMPVDSLINFMNAINKRINRFKFCWFGTIGLVDVNLNSVLSVYDSKIRTDKNIALKFLENIADGETIYYYYWFLSESLKLDEDIALLAIHRNWHICKILRNQLLENKKIIDEIDSEKRKEEMQKTIENLNAEQEREVERNQFHECLNDKYTDFIKEKKLPDYYLVDLFDLKNLDNIDVAIMVLEFLVIEDESYGSITLNENLFQTKEFLEKLANNDYAPKILQKIEYKVDLKKIDIDLKKDLSLIEALLNKEILLPQCPSSLINTPERGIQLLHALEYQYYVDTDWYLDDVIISLIRKYPDNDELVSLYCSNEEKDLNKRFIIEDPKLSSNTNLMKKVLWNDDSQSSLFKKLYENNYTIFEDEEFLSFYCEKFNGVSKKVTFLPDIKNEELIKKYYVPLLTVLKDKLLLGSTLMRKYKKYLVNKQGNETKKGEIIQEKKEDLLSKYKDINDKYKRVYEVILYDGEIYNEFCIYGEPGKTLDILKNKLLIIKNNNNNDNIYVGKAIKVRGNPDYFVDSEIVQIYETPEKYEHILNKLTNCKKEYRELEERLREWNEKLDNIRLDIDNCSQELNNLSFAFFGVRAQRKNELYATIDLLEGREKFYNEEIIELETKLKDFEKTSQNCKKWMHSFKKYLIEKNNDNEIHDSEIEFNLDDYNFIDDEDDIS